ncbi:MAG: hypothetical protein Q9M50_05385 [Methylococcales bacterium]|nr:hypothetical protein [Methylococcales bacterium]
MKDAHFSLHFTIQINKMFTRRHFIQTCALLLSHPFSKKINAATVTNNYRWFMPDEAETHKRTWMAFGASQKIWGKKLLPEVQKNLATIANAIA